MTEAFDSFAKQFWKQCDSEARQDLLNRAIRNEESLTDGMKRTVAAGHLASILDEIDDFSDLYQAPKLVTVRSSAMDKPYLGSYNPDADGYKDF